MFTGLITDIGTVRSAAQPVGASDKRIEIVTRYPAGEIATGASIACNGVCLTVVEKGAAKEGKFWFAVDASAETLALTSLKEWTEGTRVNLERSLRVGDELGGHIVSGHVDGVARLAGKWPEGGSLRLDFQAPEALMPYIAVKGSIAVDGVSLTVNAVDEDIFSVNIIPHTQQETTLGTVTEGQAANLEIDILARYVARLEAARAKA